MKLAAVLALSVSLLPACLRCGFEGDGDQMYVSSDGESTLMTCANGGFVYMAGDEYVEGRQLMDGTRRGAVGETGAIYFSEFAAVDPAAVAEAQEFASPELPGTWTPKFLDETDLDHAHVLCADLETRAWWTSSYLPKTTTFANGLDSITFTSDGSITLKRGGATEYGWYSNAVGVLGAELASGAFTAVYADAQLTVTDATGQTTTYVQTADASTEKAQ